MTIAPRIVPVVDHTGGIKSTALFFSVILLVLGVLGFVPGATSDVGAIRFLGDASGAMLFGIFQVSVLLNLIHLLLGVVGVLSSRTGMSSVAHLCLGGLLLLVICAYGVMILPNEQIDFLALNAVDNWLHLVLGLGMLGSGLYGRRHLRLAHDDPLLPPPTRS